MDFEQSPKVFLVLAPTSKIGKQYLRSPQLTDSFQQMGLISGRGHLNSPIVAVINRLSKKSPHMGLRQKFIAGNETPLVSQAIHDQRQM